MSTKSGARLGALLCSLVLLSPGEGRSQLLHRPGCNSVDCEAPLFELEVERMTRMEGPLANDRDAGDLRVLQRRIQNELRARPDDPELLLALSEAQFGLADPLPALGSATRALAAGADSGLALRAQGAARMRVSGGERDGAALYLAGVARMTRQSAPRFLADMLPMLTQDELDWWRSIDVERLRGWTREYWEHRAALAGVTVEERLAEHMRRTAMAVAMFAPPGTGSGAVGYGDLLRQPELRVLPYDDRGLVYIRRGAPHDELRVPSDVFSGDPVMTWLYAGVDGTIDAFHFGKGLSSGSGFRVVIAPACDANYLGSGMPMSATSVSGGWVARMSGMAGGEVNRAQLSCFGGDAFTRRANASMNSLAMRQESMRALEQESPRLPFREPIPAFFDFYMFRSADGGTDVVTPIVVPAAAGAAQPLEVLVSFADEGGGVARREATSSSLITEVHQSILSSGEGWGVTYLTTVVEPAASAAFRVVVRDPLDPDAGGIWGGTVPIRAFDGPGLQMSDVVVAGSGPSSWNRGSTRLFLLPARSFQPGTPVALFYELYDMVPGATYETELVLRPVRESVAGRLWTALTGAGEVRVRFETRAPDDASATMQELRSMQLPMEEGRYSLTVRVTGANGQTAESARDVIISEDAARAAGGAADEAVNVNERVEDD